MPGITTHDRPAPAMHVREHRSVLSAVEKRVLVALAERLPRWISSDHLTALGAASMAGTACAFALARTMPWMLAVVPCLLALNWFGDSLDGTVARVRQQQRPRYGFYVDHVVDLANTVLLFAGMALSGLLSGWVASALLAGYLLLAGESFLATHALGVFRLSFCGFGPSELRILLSIGALAAIVTPVVNPFGLGERLLFDVGGGIGAIGMFAAFTLSAIRNAATLYRAEPLPEGPR